MVRNLSQMVDSAREYRDELNRVLVCFVTEMRDTLEDIHLSSDKLDLRDKQLLCKLLKITTLCGDLCNGESKSIYSIANDIVTLTSDTTRS